MLINKYILLLIVLQTILVFGQPGNGQFMNYGVKDGLCEEVCSGVVQDSRGFYWISGQGGINRFDGIHFKSYFPSEQLQEKQVLDNSRVFFEYAPNRLLVTLGNSQAFVLNTISQEFTAVKSLRNRNALDILKIPGNRFLVSSVDTIFVLNSKLEIDRTLVPPLKEKNSGLQVNMLTDSECMVTTGKEFFLFEFRTNKFRPVNLRLPTEGLFHTGYNLLYVDQEHQWIYLVNYFKGMVRINYQGEISYSWDLSVLHNELCGLPNKIIPDATNKRMLWVAGDHGIAYLDMFTHKGTRYAHDPDNPLSISDNLANHLFLDSYQNLWVTTYKGVSVLNKNSMFIDDWKFPVSSEKPLMNMCRISADEVLASNYFGKVYCIHEKTGQYGLFYPEDLDNSWFVFRDGNTVVHGGSGVILNVVDLQTKRVKKWKILEACFNQSELVTMGFRHSSGDWWFSGNRGGGLVRYNPVSKRLTHFSRSKNSFSGSYFTCYSEAPNGDLWFSSNKTQILTHWIKAEDRFEEVNFGDIFEKRHQSIIQCMVVDKTGNVWIGFEGSGLVQYETRSRKTTVFGKKQGIPSNFIYTIALDDQQRLWVGTRKGLACLEPDLKTAHYFGVANGFPSEHFDQCIYFDVLTGMLWVASDNYLLRFHPDKLLKNQRSDLKVFLDEFVVSNQKQVLGQRSEYRFSPTENTVQFAFSTLNPLRKHRIEYHYLLEGANEKWISLGTNANVSFPSLPSGIYVFHLRAKIPGTKEWVYLENPVRFVIGTPWYRTWWFKLLVVLASAGLIFLVTRMYFLRKIEKQRAILEKQRAVQEERDRIAYDMHDDLGSGLTKIAYLSKQAVRRTENSGELIRINETSLELVKNMSELIWAMKVENDSLADLMSYLRRYAMEYLDANNLSVVMEVGEFPEDQQISGEIRRQVFLIYKEALHNMVKHSGTDRVLIQIHVDDKLHMLIRDYGKGFAPDCDKNHTGNGMKTMQNRTKRLKGELEINSSEQGVELKFEFPLEP